MKQSLQFPLIAFELIKNIRMNNIVTFTFAAGTPSGNQTPTNALWLSVVDSNGNPLISPALFGPNITTGSVSLPPGTGYKATLTAKDASGVADINPPTVIFDVIDPPPPPAPPDPTLSLPN